MNNIEELHLSVKHLNDFEDTKVPNTLRKLHIKFGSYHQFNAENTQSHDFHTLENFLLLLPKQLESLTSIAMTNDKHFSDMNKLNALKNIFPHLNSFQYFIQTSHCPFDEINEVYRLPDSTYILQTNPRVVSFGSELRNGVKYLTNDYHIACQRVSNLTQLQLYNSPVLLLTDQSLALGYTFKQLLQLRQICYHFSRSYSSGEAALQKTKQLTELLARAPNLKYAHLEADTSQEMIEKLTQMIIINVNALKKISHLQCKCSNFMETQFHCSFLIELAQLVPHLKYLYLRSFHSLTSDEILSPKLAIDHAQQYFKDIINLILRVRMIKIRGVDKLEEQLQQWRHKKDQRIRYYTHYRSFSEDASGFDAPFNFISIWF